MLFRTTTTLSLRQALEVANGHLDNAYNAEDREVALVFAHDAKSALSQAKSADKKYPDHLKDVGYQVLRNGIANAYTDLGQFLEYLDFQEDAQAIRTKAEKWGGNAHSRGRLGHSPPKCISQSSTSTGNSQGAGLGTTSQYCVATIPPHIFPKNVRPPTIDFKLPGVDERFDSTPQLVYCISLLQATYLPDHGLDPDAQKWLKTVEMDADEHERLNAMLTELIRVFKRDEIKDAKAVAEVVYLAPVLNKNTFQDVLQEFYSVFNHSGLLNLHHLEGIAQLIQGAGTDHLSADDFVKILELISGRLRGTHPRSSQYMHQLTLALSHTLDAMADANITDLDRERLHEPLSKYLSELMKSHDPFLVYQASYAYQALLYVPDNESLWKAALRRTARVIKGISGLATAVKNVDITRFMDGLEDIQKGFEGASKVAGLANEAYKDVTALVKSGKSFIDSLKEGFIFKSKKAWYSALRGADILIQNGELASFRKLVYEAPCRYDPAFQWGVCQRLGEMAANPMWDGATRRSAIALLGEMYKNDEMWGQHSDINRWIINILTQLAASTSGSSGVHATAAEILLSELEMCEDVRKQNFFQECRSNIPINYPLKLSLPELGSPSLLDRVQNRQDVELSLRMLKKQRTMDRGVAVYVPPQAKNGIQASDETRFPLMERVQEFLGSERKVFLLLGDSGAGKSTFTRELDFQLWQSYKKKTGRVPLHINLPTIEKPEHDMVAKQLRKSEFTEPQIREMKHHRKFILICDGYDESQQIHNLYMSNRLNQPGEWDAQMVISCRSEYVGADYRDRFQPRDRNNGLNSQLFQEAVITPFSVDQIHDYIKQYVAIYEPLWQIEDYKQTLEAIPSLADLVKNPFLMALSLDVLPRMVDPGQRSSTLRVTRVALYDLFIEYWLERSKKRLGEKDLSPQAKDEFERLSAEGFTRNGIWYLKKLAVAIYKEQDGHPVVEYSQSIDEGTWKDAFFRFKDKQLLHEACPITRNGNQHRFIHRSILEYGLARAIFDPQDMRNKMVSEPVMGRQGSVSSVISNESQDDMDDECIIAKQEPDSDSPLVWRNFVNDHSLLNFLEERVQQESLFKEQLFSYIEHSKVDKKWRKAAANAITILVRAGVQFNGADLRGIQIPGADISYGVFDSAQLQEANLKNVNLQGTWLRQTDFSRADMKGAQFGELPYLSVNNTVISFAYSPDGESFAVCLDGGFIRVYTTLTWQSTLVGGRVSGGIDCVLYSPTGDQILFAGDRYQSSIRERTVGRIDEKTGKLSFDFLAGIKGVRCLAYSLRGDTIVSAGRGMDIWDSTTGQHLRRLSDDEIPCVACSPDGGQVVSGTQGVDVKLWDVAKGICSSVLSGHSGEVKDVAYSPREDQVASASRDGTIRLWNTRTLTCIHVLSSREDPIFSIAYSPKGDKLVSGHEKTVRLWDVESGVSRHTFVGHNGRVRKVAYSPRGDQIASGSDDRTVRLWDVSATASTRTLCGHTGEIRTIQCSPAGDVIFTTSDNDSTIQLWDAETGSHRQTLPGPTDSVYDVALPPHGIIIASYCSRYAVSLWDVETEAFNTYHNLNCQDLAKSLSPQGRLIAGGVSGQLWDVATGDRFATLYEGYSIASGPFAYSPCGNLIAFRCKCNTLKLWRVDSHESTVVKHLSGDVRCIKFSPQGTQIAVANYTMDYIVGTAMTSNVVHLLDVKSGTSEHTMTGHSDRISCIAYSVKGDLVASGSDDKTVRVWDVASGQCRAMIPCCSGKISGICWRITSDTNYLAAACEKRSILMWKLTEDRDSHHTDLQWGNLAGALVLEGASIQGVRGLSKRNKKLLKQRGAQEEPEILTLDPSMAATTVVPDDRIPKRRKVEHVPKSNVSRVDKQNKSGV